MRNTTKHLGAMLLSLCAIFSTSCDNGEWSHYSAVGGLTCAIIYPRRLVVEGRKYRLSNSDEDLRECVGEFYGYAVNASDLEKWKEYDGNEDIIYAIDYENNIACTCTYEEGEGLVDRFMLFTVKDSTDLALYDYIHYNRCVLVNEPEKSPASND